MSNDTTPNQYAMQNPLTQYPQPPFEKQPLIPPGSGAPGRPAPGSATLTMAAWLLACSTSARQSQASLCG